MDYLPYYKAGFKQVLQRVLSPSVLWKLQVVAALGPLSSRTMDGYRSTLATTTGSVAWQSWGCAQPVVTAKLVGQELQISMQFATRVPEESAYLLQTTFLADAAVRLGGIGDKFTGVAGLPDLLKRAKARRWILEGENREDLNWSGAIVLAVRDAYMHVAAAEPSASDMLWKFRSKMCGLPHDILTDC